MKKIVIISSFILLLGIGFIGGLLLHDKLVSHAAPAKTVHMVSLLTDKANPDFLAIHPGEYVQFNSKDGKTHIIAQGHGDGFGDQHEHNARGLESPEIAADEGYKVVFKNTGTYDFHDHENPKIHISILVYKATIK